MSRHICMAVHISPPFWLPFKKHTAIVCYCVDFFMGGDGVVMDGQDNTCGLVPTFCYPKNDDPRTTKKWGAEQIRHPQRQFGLRFNVTVTGVPSGCKCDGLCEK
jgi:hypothetical protein